MTGDQKRALFSLAFGGIGFPLVAYWMFGDEIVWWVYLIIGLLGAGGMYQQLTKDAAYHKMANRDD